MDFWDHVEKVFDHGDVLDRMVCKFCGHSFARGTSISRIKWHLSRETGHNVAICTDQVPKEVQEAAFLAMCGSNERRKTMANSSNVNRNAISTGPLEQHNEVDHLGGGIGSLQTEVQGTEQGVGEGRTSSHAEEGNRMDACETRGEAPQATDQLSPYTIELMDRFIAAEIQGDCLPEWSVDDAPESGRRTEQVGQVLEPSILMACRVDNLAGDGGGIQMGVEGASEARASSCLKASNDMENSSDGNQMENITGEIMHIDRRITPENGLLVASQETREDPSHAEAEAEAGEQRTTSYTEVGKDIENMAGLRAQRVPGCSMRDAPESVLSTEQGGQIIGVDTLAGGGGRIQVEFQGTEKGMGEGRTSSIAEAGNHKEDMAGEMMHIDTSITVKRHISEALETERDALKATEQVSQVDIERKNWQAIASIAEQMEKENGGLEQPSSCSGPTRNTSRASGQALPTSSTKPVGQAFEENRKLVWSWLVHNGVSSIGIYGMGGVGKTTMLQHIYNRADISHHVYWVTVSQDFSIHRLQNLIAKRLRLDLANEDDELHRATKLSGELKNIEKWILILDDLWNSFELHNVGIPIPEDGCKMIVTTRSDKVCHQMNIERKIKVKPLSEKEAWTLFVKQHGHITSLSPKVKKIAQSVTEECDGLPLGIITIAGAMKGGDDIEEWSNALEELRQSRFTQDKMGEDVFRVLRFSYMHLNDPALQHCFLYCALFPEDFAIPRDDLIAYLIDEAVIKGLEIREKEFDKGHSMLNRLEKVCLLESCNAAGNGGRAVKMHDLIRDMAIQIQQENSPIMVKAGAHLNEMPDKGEWTKNLVTVSLMQNRIEKISSTLSPRCRRLSTLLLCKNDLRFIGDSFFKHLSGLKILDLSNTRIERLPDSVSDLVRLVSLLLSDCDKLKHVPSLKELRELKRLDLKGTKLYMMPQGMEGLSNLRHLRSRHFGDPQTKFIACLKKLENWECYFGSHFDFLEYLKCREKPRSLRTYRIFVGKWHHSDMSCNYGSKVVWLGNLSIERDGDCHAKFPNDIEELRMWSFNGARSLCHVASLKDATELALIYIRDCNSMESLVSSFWFFSPLVLPLQFYNGIFSGLKMFDCCRCKSMKKLFPLVLLRNLKNLEKIKVWDCEKLEEIIETRDGESVMDVASSSSFNAITGVILPKLRILSLDDLPELKSIYSVKLICDSLKKIEVRHCEKLKRMPFSFPLLENGQPCPLPSLNQVIMYPEEWWERVVEWDHPKAKDVLRLFIRFC